jgi:hypothetical protein
MSKNVYIICKRCIWGGEKNRKKQKKQNEGKTHKWGSKMKTKEKERNMMEKGTIRYEKRISR